MYGAGRPPILKINHLPRATGQPHGHGRIEDIEDDDVDGELCEVVSTKVTSSHRWCKRCDYDLRSLTRSCPECGLLFDPNVPRTWHSLSPKERRQRRRRGMIWLAAGVVVSAVLTLFMDCMSLSASRTVKVGAICVCIVILLGLFAWIGFVMRSEADARRDRIEKRRARRGLARAKREGSNASA